MISLRSSSNVFAAAAMLLFVVMEILCKFTKNFCHAKIIVLLKLNLPEFDISVRRSADGHLQVADRLRGKFVALTPEEWVRQHFVNFLIEYRGFPPAFMANEVALRHNGVHRRCDTVVYDSMARPIAIVEYKAPTIAVTESVFDQIVRYNMVLDVRWLIVSNGIRHFCCKVGTERNSYAFVKDIPHYLQISGTK